MQEHDVNVRCLWAWIFVAVSAPLAHMAGHWDWLTVGIASVICATLCAVVLHLSDRHRIRRPWYSGLQTLWLVVVMSAMLRWSASCWPTGRSFPLVPLTLLILALFAAWDGALRASRTTSVLFWFIALLYNVVLAAGTKNLTLTYMIPRLQLPGGSLIMLLLLPSVGAFLPCKKRLRILPLLLIAAFSVVVSAWTIGTLSPMAAKAVEQPFYVFSRSLSLQGIAERFESLVSVALTMGYFTLFVYLLSGVYHLTEDIFPGQGKKGIAIAGAAAAALMLAAPNIPEIIMAAGAFALWILLPVIVKIFWKKSKIWD